MSNSILKSISSSVPTIEITNDQLSQLVETSDNWITTRTGIKKRYISNSNSSLVDLAVEAAKKTLDSSDLDPLELDLIILATSSPDDLFGSASQIQNKIGAYKAVAFDITAACSGFIVSLVTAYQFIQTGTYKNILVIGADVLSRWVNWLDRGTCILFGDAAGAMLFQSSASNNLLGFKLKTDGQNYRHLNLPYVPKVKSLTSNINIVQGKFGFICMNGKEVYKFATTEVPQLILETLNSVNMTTEQVDWLVLHQANERILKTISQKLNIPYNKVLSNLSNYGNTSAASLPLVLDEAIQQGKIKENDIIVLAGFGAGLTWGVAILKI
uniref:Beta-ketoacyl-[acyl-carrier-protein] synthase III n=1 Tax=Corynoplastis japonica TaxID=700918 RepID=A0A1X9PTT9_9RHOD|nr:beta-ketoacyl-ACP synthase III [Corynoplastis japonica]